MCKVKVKVRVRSKDKQNDRRRSRRLDWVSELREVLLAIESMSSGGTAMVEEKDLVLFCILPS